MIQYYVFQEKRKRCAMQHLMKLFIIFSLLFVINIYSYAQTTHKLVIQHTKDISNLSATSLYNENKKQLQTILKSFLKKNRHIEALSITPNNGTILPFTFYRKNDLFFFMKKKIAI